MQEMQEVERMHAQQYLLIFRVRSHHSSHSDILSSHMKGEFYSHPTFGTRVVMCCFYGRKIVTLKYRIFSRGHHIMVK